MKKNQNKIKTEAKATGVKRRVEGIVVSNKMTNAVVVRVERKVTHPKYGKIIKKAKKFYARTDEKINEGTTVVIEESRPLSKLIRWVVVEKK